MRLGASLCDSFLVLKLVALLSQIRWVKLFLREGNVKNTRLAFIWSDGCSVFRCTEGGHVYLGDPRQRRLRSSFFSVIVLAVVTPSSLRVGGGIGGATATPAEGGGGKPK